MNNLHAISHLNPRTILDLGAHLGSWAQEAEATWPEAIITCIEGNPKCEPFLAEEGWHYKIAMLGKEEGDGLYYQQPGADTGTGNSLYRELTPFFDGCTPEPVKITTLNALLGEDAQYDLAKIDCQGSEIDIMQGGLEIIKRCKAVLLETSVVNYNDGAPLQDFVFGFMNALGFTKRTHVADTHRCIPPHDLIQQDYLFEKEV